MSWKRPFFDLQNAAATATNEGIIEKEEQKLEHKLCNQIYFVEPLAWMKTVAHSEQGRLNCPKCDSKLGSFSWIMGCQCPCGSKVAPAFYLVPSKVEWSNMVKNIQVTL